MKSQKQLKILRQYGSVHIHEEPGIIRPVIYRALMLNSRSATFACPDHMEGASRSREIAIDKLYKDVVDVLRAYIKVVETEHSLGI